MRGKRFLAILLTGILSASALAACGKEGNDTSGGTAESNEVTFVFTKGGFDAPSEDNIIKDKICEDADVTLNHIAPPAANYDEKLTLILSGQEGELPDMAKIQNTQFVKLFDYADQGALLDLTDLLDKMPNVKEQIPQAALDMCSKDGKLWAIPVFCSPNRMNTIIRQDWLDNLGLEVPTTLDEYHDVLKAFTFDDPDQNGQDDTYGMTGLGMEALDPYLGAFGVVGVSEGFFYEDNGKLISQDVNPKAKEGLAVLRDWYAEGLIDPEFAIMKNETELNDKAMKNQYGLTYRWWTWEPKIEMELQKVDPNVSFARIAPPIGPDGTSAVRGVGAVNGCVVILKNAKNVDACLRLINYLHSENGMMTAYSGVEGVHWEKRDDGKYYTLPQFDKDQGWIQWYAAFECEWPLLQVETPLVQSRRDAFKWPVITNAADGYITDAKDKYFTDLKTLTTDAYIKIITGQKPLDYFDEFVEEWYAKGGQEWTDQNNEIYQSKK